MSTLFSPEKNVTSFVAAFPPWPRAVSLGSAAFGYIYVYLLDLDFGFQAHAKSPPLCGVFNSIEN